MAGKTSAVLGRILNLNFKQISKELERFISNYVSKNSANGVVVGLSGGLDSSVIVKLSVNALGPEKVFGVIMPGRATPKEDVDHAIGLARDLQIEHAIIDLGPVVQKYSEVLPEGDKKAIGNITARIRMSILYYYAGLKGYLVAGTGDKSEYYIGYFTKYGDGGTDIMPIADLYKTQVKELARYLGVPPEIVAKKSSPRLWDKHLAEDEIGMDYETVDSILHLMIDKKMKPKSVAGKLDIPLTSVLHIRDMIAKSAHKRRMAEIAHVKK